MAMSRLMKLHALATKKLNSIIGHKALLQHSSTGKRAMVTCTIANIESERISSELYIGKQSLKFEILYSELQEQSMPIKGYSYITFNNVKYAILEESFDAFLNSIIIYGVINEAGV